MFRKSHLTIGIAMLALASCSTSKHRYAGPLIAAPATCADIAFPIYFEPGSATVTREAQQMILSARQRTNGCQVTGVDVVGLADAVGAPGANLALSERRADAVTRVLASRGFGKAPVHVAAAGAAEASMPGGETKPVRRRADVTIRVAPAASAH